MLKVVIVILLFNDKKKFSKWVYIAEDGSLSQMGSQSKKSHEGEISKQCLLLSPCKIRKTLL